jgi:hypothetical protein
MNFIIHTKSFLLGMVFAWIASYAIAALYKMIFGRPE